MARQNLIGMAVLLGVIAALAAVPSPATNDVDESPQFQRNLLRWKAMGDDEKSRIRQRYEQDWSTMAEVERAQVRKNFERFHKLDPVDQRTLRSSHERWLAPADDERKVALRARMRRLRGLSGDQREHALFVGATLSEAGEDVQKAARQRERRRKALAALRDVYRELPPQVRERLHKMPPWRRQMVIRHIVSERRGHFARLFQSTLDVPAERFQMRHLMRQLTPEERRVFHQMPPRLKKKVMQQMSQRKATDEQKLKALRQMIQRAQKWQRGKGKGKGKGQRPPRDGQRPPRGPRDGRQGAGSDN